MLQFPGLSVDAGGIQTGAQIVEGAVQGGNLEAVGAGGRSAHHIGSGGQAAPVDGADGIEMILGDGHLDLCVTLADPGDTQADQVTKGI